MVIGPCYEVFSNRKVIHFLLLNTSNRIAYLFNDLSGLVEEKGEIDLKYMRVSTRKIYIFLF